MTENQNKAIIMAVFDGHATYAVLAPAAFNFHNLIRATQNPTAREELELQRLHFNQLLADKGAMRPEDVVQSNTPKPSIPDTMTKFHISKGDMSVAEMQFKMIESAGFAQPFQLRHFVHNAGDTHDIGILVKAAIKAGITIEDVTVLPM